VSAFKLSRDPARFHSSNWAITGSAYEQNTETLILGVRRIRARTGPESTQTRRAS